MTPLFNFTLTRRILGLIVLGLVGTSWLILYRSEVVIEDVLLDQAKQQAHVFMLGIESEILRLDNPLDEKSLQAVIDETLQRDKVSQLGFHIFQMYFFDDKGTILAHSEAGEHKPKAIRDHYARLFNSGTSYLGERVEYVRHPQSGRITPKADIIVPLHYQGRIAAALEVEIDLEQTINALNLIGNRYKKEIVLIVAGGLLLGLFFIWFVVHRWMLAPIHMMAKVTEQIADTWDAITGDRVYREGMSLDNAIALLQKEQHSGQWDPELIEQFIDMVKTEECIREQIEQDMFDHNINRQELRK